MYKNLRTNQAKELENYIVFRNKKTGYVISLKQLRDLLINNEEHQHQLKVIVPKTRLTSIGENLIPNQTVSYNLAEIPFHEDWEADICLLEPRDFHFIKGTAPLNPEVLNKLALVVNYNQY